MEKNYYRLGQIHHSFLANDTESFNNMVEWQKKVGRSAFTFTYDDESRKK